MNKEYVMGIDLGTSSVKVVLTDRSKDTVWVSQQGYEVEIPEKGLAQQRPQVWWEQTKTAVRKVMNQASVFGSQIKAVGFSGQMHGLVVLDKEKRPLMPAVIWMDQRSSRQQREVLQAVKKLNLEEELMNRAHTGMLICSLLWVKENLPEIYEKTAHVLLPKDYIRLCMGGTVETDETDAAGSLAFSVRDRRWCGPLLEELGISKELFPAVVKPYDVTGRVTGKAASETGLEAGTILVAGGADSAMQLTGNGVINDGALAVNIGTASQLLAVTSKPVYDKKLRTQMLCHGLPGLWYQQCGSLNGGNALGWFKNRILQSDAGFGQLDEAAGTVAAGSEGLIFLPYLAGERAPYENPDARGMFLGLSLKHEQAHMVRSVMEGIALNLRECLDIFKEAGISADNSCLIVSGGGARGSTWTQILADVFAVPVCRSKTQEEACTGAAVMAAAGAGWYSSVSEAVQGLVKTGGEPVDPIPEHVKEYQEKRTIFRRIYSSLFDNTIGVCYDWF